MPSDKSREELNDFWQIDKLIPPKKTHHSFGAHTYDTEAVEIIVTAKESTSYNKLNTIEMRPSERDAGKLTFTPKPVMEKPNPDIEYSPESPFIKSVKIFRQANFSYYEAFYKDGLKYLCEEGKECPEASFFSYVPQYSQLGNEQKEWYFFMRSKIRSGIVINTSYSYLLLYIFELLNVEPDKENALKMLCFIWKNYREKYYKLDPIMPEWITDFCLINMLTPSRDLFGESYRIFLERVSLKELFICRSHDDELVTALLELSSNYDYHTSKFAVGDNLPIYEQFIPAALKVLLRSLDSKKSFFAGTGEIKRNAFAGSICTQQNKCRIDVEYCSLSRSHEMRFLISDAVKHIENRIRAYIGVKSRLTVYSLPVEAREIIDSYMNETLVNHRRIPKEEVHEYDRLYEIPKANFSLDYAKKIEEISWQTTKKLVEAFEDEEKEQEEAEKITKKVPDKPEIIDASPERMLLDALAPYSEFISAATHKDGEGERKFAAEKGKMISSVADEINEIAADIFGDIVLEETGDFYSVIEDYAEVFRNA